MCYDEHWILNKVKPNKYYYVLVDSYTEIDDGYFEAEYYDLIEENADVEEYDDYYISGTIVLKNLKYTIVNQEDIQLGCKFSVDISEIRDLLNSIENPENEISYLMQDYMSSENEVENVIIEDNLLTIETKESEGLYVKDFVNTLKSKVMELNF